MNNTLKNIGSFATSFAVSYAITNFVKKCWTAAGERQEVIKEQPTNYRTTFDAIVKANQDLEKMGLGHLVR